MADQSIDHLVKLNECRLETRDGLQVTATPIRPTETGLHLEPGEKLRVKIEVENIIEQGWGGGMPGDAHFKNITVHVTSSEFVKFLASRHGPEIDGDQISYPLVQGDQTLAEGEWRVQNVWFEAKYPSKDETVPELIATVRVEGEFDVGRYFKSRVKRLVYHEIHD